MGEHDAQTTIRSAHPKLAEVQRRLDDDIDLAALAERFGYSPFHFHRTFTKGVGETPKAHVARLRLEKALLLVAVTRATFLDIALAVGFHNHETFTRAFKRQFGMTPRALRGDPRNFRRRQADSREEIFKLSRPRFVSLPPMHLLAVRRMGPYTEPSPAPYLDGDLYWRHLVGWAEASGLGHSRLPYGFFPDMPGITPPGAMRTDFCIEIEHEVTGDERCFYAPFAGGRFAMIEHRGPSSTVPQAYYALVDAILAIADRYVLSGGAPFQIHREVHPGGDPDASVTEVYLPVARPGQETAPLARA
jgi:AraC family transcriptional regulator